MKAENLKLWVNYISNQPVPLLNVSVQSILRLCADERATCKQLADIILRDPTLAARVLRVANSPFYHRHSQSLTDIRQAVLLLGFDKIAAIALTVSIINMLVRKNTMQHIVTLMTQSLHTAMLARYVANRNAQKHADDIYLAGLLYDIGEIVFWSLSGNSGEFLLQQLQSYPLPVKVAQQELLGTTFDELTAALLNEWGLSALLISTLKHQQCTDPCIQSLVVSHRLIKSYNTDPVQFQTAVDKLAKILNASHADTEALIHSQYQETSRLSQYFMVYN